MSRIGDYLRVSPAELTRLQQDPRQAHAFVSRTVRDPARSLCVEKFASDIQILLDQVGLPIDVVRGGVRLCDDCRGGDGIESFSVEEAADGFTPVSFDEPARDGDAILRWFG